MLFAKKIELEATYGLLLEKTIALSPYLGD